MKKVLAVLLAALMVLSLCACKEKVHVMSHAEYEAAELKAPVVVECYVQNHQSYWDNKITVYAADQDGAYFIYNMACASQEEADKLVPGTKIRVTGYKDAWSGEVEIIDATYEILEGSYIAPAKDVTSLLGTDELIKHQNEYVAFKGMTVEASEGGAAFTYKWDNSGSVGDDLYFNVSLNGQTYSFTVESYLTGADTDVYKAVQNLKVGDVVDMEGFAYWYEGLNPHITKLTVVQPAPEKSEYTPLCLDLKNKTGVTITGCYIFPTGAEDKGANLVSNWPDKDADGDKYEIFAYILRPVAETYDIFVEFEDGTNATWAGRAIANYDKLSFKNGVDPAKWEQEAAEDEDKPAMDAVKAAGKTTDGFYPGYEKLGLELKNKTELEASALYLYEAGADYTKYNNLIEFVVDEEGNPIGTWKPGKGGLYLFGFFLRPYSEAYEIRLEFTDGSVLTITDIDLFTPDGDGHLANEISVKDAVDPDLTKIAYDDGDPEPLQYIADAITEGTTLDNWYPEY